MGILSWEFIKEKKEGEQENNHARVQEKKELGQENTWTRACFLGRVRVFFFSFINSQPCIIETYIFVGILVSEERLRRGRTWRAGQPRQTVSTWLSLGTDKALRTWVPGLTDLATRTRRSRRTLWTNRTYGSLKLNYVVNYKNKKKSY